MEDERKTVDLKEVAIRKVLKNWWQFISDSLSTGENNEGYEAYFAKWDEQVGKSSAELVKLGVLHDDPEDPDREKKLIDGFFGILDLEEYEVVGIE